MKKPETKASLLRRIFRMLPGDFGLNTLEKRENPAETPVFTVITPVYDRTSELKECIESVLSQSFRSFEFILVCDGSPPETLAVVDAFAENPLVRVYKFPDNSGNACRGRNQAVSMARGKYAAFLDSDDVAMPDRLENTLEVFESTGADIVYGAARFIADGSRELPGIRDGLVLSPEPFDLEKAGLSNPILTSTAAVRLSCLGKFGAFRPEMKYREDHELWLRLAFNRCKFACSEKIFSAYRVHKGNAELKFIRDDKHWRDMMLSLYRQNAPVAHGTR